MLTALRQELRDSLQDIPVTRPMSIRRSEDPEALLSCDLPLITDDAGLICFTESLTSAGWTVRRDRDRLELDRPIPIPEFAQPVSPTGEVSCCMELLRLHPGGDIDPQAIRQLAKTAEQGAASLEKLSRQLHRQWAAMLREGKRLPSALLPYLEKAYEITH